MPKKFLPSGHWTKGLTGEQTTTKLGARFHLRKLFFRQEEFSQDELEFIIQYLVHETTIQEQQWWVALAQHERLEIVSRLKLHHVAKGDEQIIWFSRNETSKDCILLYGNAEAKPIDPSAAVVLSFSEGSVVGNLNLTQSVKSHQQSPMNEQQPHTLEVLASSDFASNWRRVKRERQFRSALQHYNKLVLFGPADYLLLTSSDVLETISRAADRVERDNWVKAFGLERFAGCIRRRVFEPGAFLAKEDELLDSMYIIMEGECRASISGGDTLRQPPKKTLAEELVLHTHKFRSQMQGQLPIASLGPLSCVGDISVILSVPEPTTIQAITTVTTLWLSQEDIAKECGDLRDPVIVASIEKLRAIAYDTLAFILDRVEAEAKHAQADQRLKIERIREQQREKKELVSQSSSGGTMRHQSSINGPLIKTAAWAQPSAAISETKGQQSTLPAVVLRHTATIAKSKTESDSSYPKDKMQQQQEEGRETDDMESSPHAMARQQKRVARAFTTLHSPTAGKSLGDAFANCRTAIHDGRRLNAARTRSDPFDGKKPRGSSLEAEGESLFLFPTMTRQRQLHGK